ncbi:AAA family ATPase [Calditrichota bacterium LG25]
MQGYINRNIEKAVLDDLSFFPVVAVIGPRQSGKSTMVKFLAKQLNNFVYLDLERPADLNKLEDPELFFEANKDKTICLDEIQRKPNLFPVSAALWNDIPNQVSLSFYAPLPRTCSDKVQKAWPVVFLILNSRLF